MADPARLTQIAVEVLYIFSSNPTASLSDDLNNWNDALVVESQPSISLSDDLNNWDDLLENAIITSTSFEDSLNYWLDELAYRYDAYVGLMEVSLADSLNEWHDQIELLFVGEDIIAIFGDALTFNDSIVVSRTDQTYDDLNNWADAIVLALITQERVQLADTLEMSDAIAIALVVIAYPIVNADSLNNWSDALVNRIGALKGFGDSLAFSDEARVILNGLKSFSDDLNNWNDAISVVLTSNELSAALNDSLNSWNDTIALRLGHNVNLDDTFQMSDGISTADNRNLDYLRRYLNDL